MSTTERNPTTIAACGCPYDPEFDKGSLGWHLTKNHPETWFRLRTPFGTIRQPTREECLLVGRDVDYAEPSTILDYRELGDYVIESHASGDAAAMARLAETCEEIVNCDAAHVIPAGVYVEE